MKKMLESLREASRQAIEEAVDMDSLLRLSISFSSSLRTSFASWPITGRSSAAVSYTHLDVYKRQGHSCQTIRDGCASSDFISAKRYACLLYTSRCV